MPFVSRVDMESETALFSLCSSLFALPCPLFLFILLDKVQGLSRHHRSFAAVEAGDQLEARSQR